MTSLVHGLPPESLISAFPFHIVLAESSLDIVQMGSVIEQLSPDALGHFFGEHFKLLQPQINITHAEIMARTDSFFLLELLSSQMMLKGQMMPIGDTGTIVFLGSPWITDLSQVDLLEIQLTDFAIHDSTVDYLLLLQSKNTALNDTKKLAEKLAEKQQDLRARNRELRQEIEERSRIEAELAAARDQAIEASVIKSQFLANMSHEIRTPMNGIMGMGQLLLGTQLSDEQNEFTRIIYDQAEHLLDLINEILDFSKIEAGKLNLESIDFSLSELVMDISRMLQPVVEATDVDLIVLIESDVPERVCGDSARSRQVINNLVSNAIKFTPEGDVQIHLRVAPEWTNSENQPAGSQQIPIEISVQDTGIGINEEQIDKLFDSFTQADNSTTRKFG